MRVHRWGVLLVTFASCAPTREHSRGAEAHAPSAVTVEASPAAPIAKREEAPAAPARSPVAASEPAYDREVDLAERTARAIAELGRAAQVRAVGEVFLLVGAPGWDRASFARSAALVDDALFAYYNNRFRARPREAISVYLFPSSAPYEAYCRAQWKEACLSKYGFYRSDERAMVMNAGLGLGTLTHELVHPLVEADFPGAPTWLNEGIASLFEAPVIPRRGEVHGAKNWRHPRLLRALADPKEARGAGMDALFGMSDETFRGDDEDLHYATARFFCQWLDGQGALWPFYQRYRDGFAEDPTGEKAFAATVSLSPREARTRWERWVRGL